VIFLYFASLLNKSLNIFKMIFYSNETLIALAIASMPAFVSLYTFFFLSKKKMSLILLAFSAFLLRLFMAAVDPFLQDWDERFHALVAKNMINNPFKPMLRVEPIMDYDYTSWCCNHIWVHKQPLFLWQMAASMKIFGVNEIAMRLPSVILGAAMVFMIYQISEYWFKHSNIGFIAAFVYTFSFYQLELTSGRFSLDHNDLVFTCYVTASIWAFIQYLKHDFKLTWAVAIGVFVGCAVLNKWLTGFLIFGGWGLYATFSKDTVSLFKKYSHIAISALVACIVFVPWQLYIMKMFPLESAYEFEFNRKHIFEVLQGHVGSNLYHVNFLTTAYGRFLIPFSLLGIFYAFKQTKVDKVLSVSMLAMVFVVYGFFSLIVKTKMPAFVYPVSSIIIILMASGLYNFLLTVANFFLKENLSQVIKKTLLALLILFIGVYSLKPWEIAKNRSVLNTLRNAKINNTQIYNSIGEDITQKYVIINCKAFEDTEMMFNKNVNAFHWFPEQRVLDSLQNKGYQFAAFKSNNDQNLPEYITKNKRILIIDKQLK
jgi:4-amino-4-deoxy-L-arabinose transferase-like glycosyltransferase